MLRRLLVAGATALAATSLAAIPAAPAQAAGCHWRVVWDVAGVWEKPTDASPHLKNKSRGDIVGETCTMTYYNETEGRLYRAVNTDAARDGYGWMKADALVRSD
jgi:hypothetical protein